MFKFFRTQNQRRSTQERAEPELSATTPWEEVQATETVRRAEIPKVRPQPWDDLTPKKLKAEETLETEAMEPVISDPVPREKIEQAQAQERRQARQLKKQQPSPADIQRQRTMRHRLIGFAAILLGLVIVTPFVLDKENTVPDPVIDVNIPDPEQLTGTLPMPGQAIQGDPMRPIERAKVESTRKEVASSQAKDPVVKETKNPVAPKEKVRSTKPTTPEAKPVVAKPTRKKESKVEKNVVPKGSGFYVQLLATRSELAAQKMVKDLKAKSLPAYCRSAVSNGKTIWRVRVGLFKTKEEADTVVANLLLDGFNGKPMIAQQK